MTASDQAAILGAVGRKLRGANQVFSFGEDERMARAVLSITARKDFDAEGFKSWLAALKPAAEAAKPEVSVVFGNQNVKNMLSKLHFLLATTAPNPAALGSVQETLKNAF